jgi:hypothetical protein
MYKLCCRVRRSYLLWIALMTATCAVPGARPLCAAEDQRFDFARNLPQPTASQLREANRDQVVTAALSPAGRYLAVGLQSGSLVVIDTASQRLAFARPAHSEPLRHLAFADGDRYLLTGADDLQVGYWDLAESKSLLSFRGTELRHLYEVAISPDARYAAGRGFDGFGVVWDLRANKKVVSLFSYMFAFDPRSRFLVTGPRRRPGAELIWLGRGTERTPFAPEQLVNCFAIDPTGQTVAYARTMRDEPCAVVLYDVAAGREMRSLEIPDDRPDGEIRLGVSALGFSADGRHLLVGCGDGYVHRVDIATLEMRHSYQFPDSQTVGRVGFVGAQADYVMASVWLPERDAETRLWRFDGQEPLWIKPSEVAIDPARWIAAAPTAAGDLQLFDARTGKVALTVRPFLQGTRWQTRD